MNATLAFQTRAEADLDWFRGGFWALLVYTLYWKLRERICKASSVLKPNCWLLFKINPTVVNTSRYDLHSNMSCGHEPYLLVISPVLLDVLETLRKYTTPSLACSSQRRSQWATECARHSGKCWPEPWRFPSRQWACWCLIDISLINAKFTVIKHFWSWPSSTSFPSGAKVETVSK